MAGGSAKKPEGLGVGSSNKPGGGRGRFDKQTDVFCHWQILTGRYWQILVDTGRYKPILTDNRHRAGFLWRN